MLRRVKGWVSSGIGQPETIASDFPNLLRHAVKIVLPCLALLPGCILVLGAVGGLSGSSALVHASLLAHLPAISLAVLVRSFAGDVWAVLAFVAGVMGWSAFIAYALHRIVRLITAEDFDWYAFAVGMVGGALPGALLGWRVWIRLYASVGLMTSCVAGAVLGGLSLGIYMGSCWSKALYQ